MAGLISAARTELVLSVREWPAELWNVLTGARSFYLSHGWLARLEQDRSVDTRYAVVATQRELLGALPLYAVERETNEDYDPARILPGPFAERYVLAGSRRAYTNHLLINSSLTRREADTVLAELLGVADDWAAARGMAGTLLLYASTEAAAAVRRVRPAARPVLLTLDAAIPVVGDTFDDYLARLGSRRAGKIRHELRAFEAAGYEVAVERLSGCWQDAAPLVAQVQQRYGHDETVADCRASLGDQVDAHDPDSLVFTARRAGALTALTLLYAWRDTLHARVVGFDYPRLAKAYEYFNLTYYRPLAWAYRHGYRQLHLGRDAYLAKLHRGARLSPLWAVRAGPAPFDGWREYNARVHRSWCSTLPLADLEVPPGWCA